MISKQAELAAINAVQSAIDREGLDWVAGETPISRLSLEEKHRLYNDKVGPPIKGISIESRPLHLQGVADPTCFDWRNVNGYNWMTPVRYQGSCGSCWAFSATGVIESAFNIYSGNPNLNINLSEQHLVSACCSAGSCSGGWPDWALDYAVDIGIPDEDCTPYTARNTACDPCPDWEDRVWNIEDHVYVNPSTDNFKWALQQHGPLSVVINHPEDWFYYVSGVYKPTVGAVGSFDHAVVLVGWDDSLGDRGAWICKNSHGIGFGEDGYALVDFSVLEGYRYAYAVTGIGNNDSDKRISPCGVYGDVNGDGYVTDADADLIGQHLVGNITLTDEQLAKADVNNDGAVTSIDDLIIRRYVAGVIDTFPVCEDVANIAAVDITATPSTCKSPCDITISIAWKNVGTVDGTFYPGFTVNDILHGGAIEVSIPAGETWSDSYILHNATAGSYVICPSPN